MRPIYGKESRMNPVSLLTEDVASKPGGLERLAKGLVNIREVWPRTVCDPGHASGQVDDPRHGL